MPLKITELVKLRRDCKIKQSEIAKSLHLSNTAVSQRERLLIESSGDFLEAYKKALDALIEDKEQQIVIFKRNSSTQNSLRNLGEELDKVDHSQ